MNALGDVVGLQASAALLADHVPLVTRLGQFRQ
jgi:hypothetical protein